MTDKEMIEARAEQDGLAIRGWDEAHENGLTAKLGTYRVTTDDYEDDGLYSGDEGELTACIVGAEQYGNRRVSFSFTMEGYDEGNEVRDLYALDRVD